MTPYYERNGISIYHGDCLDILPRLTIAADLVLTDPPYEAEAHTLQRRIQREADDSEYGRRVVVEELPFGPMTPELRENAARLIAALCSPVGFNVLPD